MEFRDGFGVDLDQMLITDEFIDPQNCSGIQSFLNHLINLQDREMTKLECCSCKSIEKETSPLQFAPQNHPNTHAQQSEPHSQDSSKTQSSLSVIRQTSTPSDQQDGIFIRCSNCQEIICRACYLMSGGHSCKLKANESNPDHTQTHHDQPQVHQPNSDPSLLHIICQQCQQTPSIKYCENCEQFLCETCSYRIHNKGKRAKHSVEENNTWILTTKSIYLIPVDLLDADDRISKEIGATAQNLFLFQGDASEHKSHGFEFAMQVTQKQISLEYLVSVACRYPLVTSVNILNSKKGKKLHQKIEKQMVKETELKVNLFGEYIQKQQTEPEPKQDKPQILNIPMLKHNKNVSTFSNFSAISKVQSVISHNNSSILSMNELSFTTGDPRQTQNNQSILMMGQIEKLDCQQQCTSVLQASTSKECKRVNVTQIVIKKKLTQQSITHHDRLYSSHRGQAFTFTPASFMQQSINMSTSTENSIRKRAKKWPIPYLQPFRFGKDNHRSNSEHHLREFAQKGVLMIRIEKVPQSVLKSEVSREFIRNIGEREIKYVSYLIDFVSVQCLCWVIQSIKEDKMTPNQKLIQSRIKESFDLKISPKLWQSIIKYLQSQQYQIDYYQYSHIKEIPKIIVSKVGEQYMLFFQNREWEYEDQSTLNQAQEEWMQFKDLLTHYFDNHNQITGGRYGCVQYVKLNGPKPLKKCSLGKLSMYVQQAINKGFIRYHKTLLVSNSDNVAQQPQISPTGTTLQDQSQRLNQCQRDIKIGQIQLALIDMFLSYQPGDLISLAQIPLNLKKSIPFQPNIVQLGFPKLKNLLLTLSDKLHLSSTKTHVSYQIADGGAQKIQLHRKAIQQLHQVFKGRIIEHLQIIMQHYLNISVQDLYTHLNNRIGFIFDYKICNVSDFSQFTLYYCGNIMSVHLIQNVFIAYPKPQYYSHEYQHYQTQQQLFYQQYQHQYQQQQYINDHHPYKGKYSYYKQDHKIDHRNDHKQDHRNDHKQDHRNDHKQDYQQVQKKHTLPEAFQPWQAPTNNNAMETPKFNSSVEYQGIKIASLNWQSYDDLLKSEKQEEKDMKDSSKQDSEGNSQDRSIEQMIINNILDDQLVSQNKSRSKTVIEKEGSLANQQEQLYMTGNIKNDSYDLEEELFDIFAPSKAYQEDDSSGNKGGKGHHNRVKSSNEDARIKHFRGYSNNISRE